MYNNQYLIMNNDLDERQFEENYRENNPSIIQKLKTDPEVVENKHPIDNHDSIDNSTIIQLVNSQELHPSSIQLINLQSQNSSSNSENFKEAKMDQQRRYQQCCDSCKKINDKYQKKYVEIEAKIETAIFMREQYEKKYKLLQIQIQSHLKLKKNLQQMAKQVEKQKYSVKDIKKSSLDKLKLFMSIIVNFFQNINQGNNQEKRMHDIHIEIQDYDWQKKELTFFEEYLKKKMGDIHRIYHTQRQFLQIMNIKIAKDLAQSKKSQQNLQRQYKIQIKSLETKNEQLTSQKLKLIASQTEKHAIISKNYQVIKQLNRIIQQNKKHLSQNQFRLDQLQSKINHLQSSKQQSLLKKQLNELTANLRKLEQQKMSIKINLTKEIYQKDEAQKQIKKLTQEIIDNRIDYKFYRASISKKQQTEKRLRQQFGISINTKLNSMQQMAQKSSRKNRQTINKEFDSLLLSLHEQLQKFNIFYDQFWKLEELNYKLSCDLIEKNAQISLKDSLLQQSAERISQSILDIQSSNKKLSQITIYYQKEAENIKQAFQQKLRENIQQISSYYEKLISNKQENAKTIIQIANQELTLANCINKSKLDQHEKQQQRYKNQIEYFQDYIKRSEDVSLKKIKSQEQYISQKEIQLQLFQQKLKKYEAIILDLNKCIHDLQAQAYQKSKFLCETHKQLESKSLKKLLSQIEQQVPFHSRQLIDLINCIFYHQSQIQKDINQLQLKIRKLQRQKQQSIANQAYIYDQKLKKQRQSYKKSTFIEEKINGLQRQIQLLKANNINGQQKLDQLKNNLEQRNQQLEIITSLEAQSQKQLQKLKNENASMKDKILLLQKQIRNSQKLNQDRIKQIQSSNKEETAKVMQKKLSKDQKNQYEQKIENLLRQNQALRARFQNQQIKNSQIIDLKNHLKKIVQEYDKTKVSIDEMKIEKSNIQKQYQNLQKQIQSMASQNKQLANRLKIAEDQIKLNKKNTFINRRTQQLSSNSEAVNQTESKIQKLQAQIKDLKKNNHKLQQKLIESQRQLGDQPSFNERKMSWNESQNLMKGYEEMIQSLRQEKELLEQQINGLKAKVKRLQGNNKIPKSYISPPKSTLIIQKSPEKNSQQEKIQSIREKPINPISNNSYFTVDCIIDNQQNGRRFLINNIQQIFAGKKLMESKLVYKYTQANKIFVFSSLLPKVELQNESFVFLFASKGDIFGVISYKKDSISKQTALIFSINNQKTVAKRPTGDSTTASAVTVEYNGDLNIGNGHLKIKSSNRILAVKEVLGKYFEQYQKKQIFGKDNWRDQMAIELTELQIHRIYMK